MCNDSELAELRACVARFRQAMEMTSFGPSAGNLTGFPDECCHHACVLLRRFLLENGFGDFRTMSGILDESDGRKHQWLQRGPIIVDITADQFQLDKVIVADDSPWHQELKGKPLFSTPSYETLLWNGDGSWTGYADIYRDLLLCLEEDAGTT